MSISTLPSGQGHHFKDGAFKRSFLVSFGIHFIILVVAGSMTLFRMSGTTYAPSYAVDLVSLPAPRPAPAAKPSPAVKTAPKEVKKQPEPAVKKEVLKPAAAALPIEKVDDTLPSGGDEAARVERRKKIEELEMEARRLYESYTTEEDMITSESAQPAETDVDAPSAMSTPTGGGSTISDIRFRAYYDRIWAKIRSSWVIPEGVISEATLLTVVRIRISASGEIEQSWIEKKSGNEYYDQSALRAIGRAKHLPALPDDISDTSLEVGINFRYPE